MDSSGTRGRCRAGLVRHRVGWLLGATTPRVRATFGAPLLVAVRARADIWRRSRRHHYLTGVGDTGVGGLDEYRTNVTSLASQRVSSPCGAEASAG